jgi:replicative superfamily II helicase
MERFGADAMHYTFENGKNKFYLGEAKTYSSSYKARSNVKDNKYLNDLSDFISDTVHPKFSLAEIIKRGIAYHHGKLPFHVRLLVEDGIRKKEVKTIICTTTLLQGVNLPVQNILIRNPNLFTRRKKDSIKLSNYEIANLRGRAGRLLKDFVGRTYILDE